MKKIISYSLFNKIYLQIPVILRAHHLLFPSFEFWLHHDGCINDSYYYYPVLKKLEEIKFIKLIKIDRPVAMCRSMLWRLLPIWENTDFIFSRDLDSLPMLKERIAMEEFISSGKIFHGINDNDQHSIPMMGGMIGFKSKEFINFTGFQSWDNMMSLCNWDDDKWNIKGSDQDFLNQYLWEKIISQSLIHKFEGPVYKNTSNITSLTTDVSDISPEAKLIANKFSNYIGASCQNTAYKYIMYHYDKCANDKLKTIINIEKQLNIPNNIYHNKWLYDNEQHMIKYSMNINLP